MQIVRVVLVNMDNTSVTLAEKMLDDELAWAQFEQLAFDLTGERKKKPLTVSRKT